MGTLIGIGNPLLDSTVRVEEAFLQEHGLVKGTMSLVDEKTQERLLCAIEPEQMTNSPGGSVANALAAARALGGEASYIGCIGKDAYGTIYEDLIKDRGIKSLLQRGEKAQGKCLVLITPDGERTFATYLGAALELSSVKEEDMAGASILHIEGYQLDGERNAAAVLEAMRIAKKHAARISIDLSDPGVISRHRELLERIIEGYVDIVFANEAEAAAYTGLEDEEAAAKALSGTSRTAVVKIGERGSIICDKGEITRVRGHKTRVVNTNGAGDTYAGALLQGLLQDKTLGEAGNDASWAAAIVVGQEEAMLTKEAWDNRAA